MTRRSELFREQMKLRAARNERIHSTPGKQRFDKQTCLNQIAIELHLINKIVHLLLLSIGWKDEVILDLFPTRVTLKQPESGRAALVEVGQLESIQKDAESKHNNKEVVFKRQVELEATPRVFGS